MRDEMLWHGKEEDREEGDQEEGGEEKIEESRNERIPRSGSTELAEVLLQG
jgi:hypothetical protein